MLFMIVNIVVKVVVEWIDIIDGIERFWDGEMLIGAVFYCLRLIAIVFD